MLEIPSLPDNSGAPNDAAVDDGGAAAACSGPDSDGPKDHRGLAGAANRWPREETMALLRIRSEMDVAFRDSNPKAPLWQQISRRLGELGYNRSAKKCKEKFENIYKYHRRTKEGREGRPNRKTYRFFDQLEALHYSHLLPNSPEHNPQTPTTTTTTTVNTNVVHHAMPCSVRFPTANHADYSTTSSNSKESGDDGDDDDAPTGKKKKRRRVTEYFERMMKEVMEKQESLHNKFLEVLEKREQDRIAREKEWKMQELARIQRERELLAQERSMAAAKDAALLAILTKITDPSVPPGEPLVNDTNNNMNVVNPVPENHDKNKDKDKDKEEQEGNDVINVEKPKQEHYRNVGSNSKLMQMSSSRWPKEEVEALIRLRTNMDVEYEGNNNNGGKGPLWEEISSAMKKIGYHRSAKRCKEKWENINKYFKRMKEKNKRRPEDSKTCPYFHQLDALYSKKPRTKVSDDQSGGNGSASTGNNDDQLKAEELLMHIMNGQEELPQSSQPEPEATDHKDDDGDHIIEPIVLQ